MNDTTSNPFMVVGTPSYATPLLDLSGIFKNGMQAGQNFRQGGQQQQSQQQPRQWPQPGQQAQGVPYANMSMPGAQAPQPQPSGTPPLYSQYLMKAFGIGQQPGQGVQSPMAQNGAPSPYTNFDYPGA